MGVKANMTDLEASVGELRGWVEALSRRVEDLEHSAFQLVDEEEVVLVAVPRGRSHDL
jgi:hypothetical protein